MSVTIRQARPEDAQVCGRICFEAFSKINTDHGFPPDVPNAEAGIGFMGTLFSHPGFWCVVAARPKIVIKPSARSKTPSFFRLIID